MPSLPRRSASSLSVLCLALAASQTAAAQDAAPKESRQGTVYVYGVAGGYGETDSASATKTDTPLTKIPQAVFVITGDLIDDQSLSDINGLVRYVPGVTNAQGEGHRDAPSFRGNVTTSDFFVDGVRDDLQYLRDLYNVDRVDVLKGPSALVFGRGTGGGALNRVTKQADGTRVRDLALTLGSYDLARVSGDLGLAATDTLNLRFNGVYEDAGSFRDHVEVSRLGLAPTARLTLSPQTALTLSGEYFSDERTTDRGVPALNGLPFTGSDKAFFGNPSLSFSDIEVNTLNAALDHRFSETLSLRTVLSYGDYEKFYQNSFAASAINPATGTVNIAAYNATTLRENLFSQTDLIWDTDFGGMGHTLLLGMELGNQDTDNLRFEGQFPDANGAERLSVSVTDRGETAATVFGRQSRNNRNELSVFSLYAQDQISVTDRLDLIVGARFEQFDLDFLDAIGADFSRKDEFVSPRLGATYAVNEAVTVYASYTQSFLPQSGEQFSSLSASTAALEPEEFENMEIGVKYQPLDELLLTAALYRLDRDNTRAPGNQPGVTVLTGAQRSEGLELALQGEIRDGWDLVAAAAFQSAEITQTTSSAPAGRKAPLVPEASASVWNRFAITPRLDAGLGVIWQDEQFTSISNAVTLPAYTRFDAALYYDLSDDLILQVNLENLTGEDYWFTAHNDNNISPGAPLSGKVTLRASF